MIIFDHRQKGLSHVQINAYIIGLFLRKYTTEKIHLFLENTHYSEIINILKNQSVNIDNIIYHEIKIKNEVFDREYKRFYNETKIFYQIFDFSIKNNEKVVLSLYSSVWEMYAMNFFSWLLTHKQFYTVLHSELERICLDKFKKNLNKFLYHLFFGIKLPLLFSVNKNMKYIVLGESIKDNLCTLLPKIKNNIISIEHGYVMEKEYQFSPFKNNIIRFGLFGMIFEEKNGNTFIKLFEELLKNNNNNFEFYVIGHIKDHKTKDSFKKFPFVRILTEQNEFLPQDIFDEYAKMVDYGVFGYNSNSFKLTASGSFWAPLSFCKPIIAIKNDYFACYFKKYGNIGFLCESFDDYCTKIKQIIKEPDISQYSGQINNIKVLKSIKNDLYHSDFFDIDWL